MEKQQSQSVQFQNNQFQKQNQSQHPSQVDPGDPHQSKMKPSELIVRQREGNILEDIHKPKIVQFLNIADFSIYKDSIVPIDEPIFEPIPPLIQFNDYEPLQIKEKTFKLRNRDCVARVVKIIQPDSRLFHVIPVASLAPKKNKKNICTITAGSKVAPGMSISYMIKFSPEAKIDYQYNLVVVTERERYHVPIVAVGKRSMIDFPDVIDFGHCPVKYESSKPVVIRNLGEKTTKWMLQLPLGFKCSKLNGVLEYQKHEQLIMTFNPTISKSYEAEAILTYDKLDAYVTLKGIVYTGNVDLNKKRLKLDKTYIALQAQATVRIKNQSKFKVDFEWRSFQSDKDEIEKKSQLHIQLEQEEAEERMLLKEAILQQNDDDGDFDFVEEDSDDEENDEKMKILKRQKKAELLLARKYRIIRKAIADDLLLYEDDIFQIEPISGEIWPSSEITITVTFKPTQALFYKSLAFCNISCCENRLALALEGEGKGPKAIISPNWKDIGDVYIDELIKENVTIENGGQIDCHFRLMQSETPFSKMFDFKVTEKILKVDERLSFDVEFRSNILGEFSETFKWELEGTKDLLNLTFKGHVIPPTFEFDKDQIDFKIVSFQFTENKELIIKNKSKVNFTFSLYIPGDREGAEKEFEIIPQRYSLSRDEEKPIQIKFTPKKNTWKYDMVLVVNIDGVGDDMLSIPIIGESKSPKVRIEPEQQLDFGNVFLDYEYEKEIILWNDSPLKAKFIIIPQGEEQKVLGTYRTNIQKGEIAPMKHIIIKVYLKTKWHNQSITLPLKIDVMGNEANKTMINIVAMSRGPIVKVDMVGTVLDFGSIKVLQDYTFPVKLINDSLIPARFHAFTKLEHSIFKPVQKQGMIPPNEVFEIDVVCNADDRLAFQDVLHIMFKNAECLDIELKCKAEKGMTIYSKESLEDIDFGTQYSHKNITQEIFVENKSQRQQKLQWMKNVIKKKKSKDDDKKRKSPLQNEKFDSTFAVVPEVVNLPAKSGIMFQFRAYALTNKHIIEDWSLNYFVGDNNTQQPLIPEVKIHGNFIIPEVTFTPSTLYYQYIWEEGVKIIRHTKKLQLSCKSELPIKFLLKSSRKEFTIDKINHELLPGKAINIQVHFDPAMKIDKLSGTITGQILVQHGQHPHEDILTCVGEVCFPNLKLSATKIDFGCILNHTQKKVDMIMKNCGNMTVNYEWKFAEDDQKEENMNPQEDYIRINEVFDILPLNGELAPGESEVVEFIYNAFQNAPFKTTAICAVRGGPDYEVLLQGNSSRMDYGITPASHRIDLKEIQFNEWQQTSFTIENKFEVAFDFKIDTSTIKRIDCLDIFPIVGKIGRVDSQKINIRFTPKIPEQIVEKFYVHVAHFEPTCMTLLANGVYPKLHMMGIGNQNLPIIKSELFKKIEQKVLKEAVKKGEKDVPTELTSFREQREIDYLVEIERRIYCKMILQNDQQKKSQLFSKPKSRDGKRKEKKEAPVVKAGKASRRKQNPKGKLLKSLQKMSMTGGFTQFIKKKDMEPMKIQIMDYEMDLGSVILGKLQSTNFKFQNASKIYQNITIDSKIYRANNIMINPEKIPRLSPWDSVKMQLFFTAKRNRDSTAVQFRKQIRIPIETKNGPVYNLIFKANVVTPALFLENNILDFGDVICGQRKTTFLRIENQQPVPAVWSLQIGSSDLGRDKKQKEDDAASDKKFTMDPVSGKLKPGQKKTIKFTFSPSVEKMYQKSFSLKIDDNHDKCVITARGKGTSINLSVAQEKIICGPVLPYNDFACYKIEITNPSDIDTELFALDLDKQQLQEEEQISKFDKLQEEDSLFYTVRKPGEKLWNNIIESNIYNQKKADMQKQIDDPEIEEEKKKEIQQKLDLLIHDFFNVPVYPEYLEEKRRTNILFLGPPDFERSKMIKRLSLDHKRGNVNLGDLLEWNRAEGNEIVEKIEKYLIEKETELTEKLEEQDKMKKKLKKGFEEWLEENPLNEEDYKYPSNDLLVELLQKRLQYPDCNAGAIFDNLKNDKLWKNTQHLMAILFKTIKSQKLQIVTLNYKNDEDDLPISQIIQPQLYVPKISDGQAKKKIKTKLQTLMQLQKFKKMSPEEQKQSQENQKQQEIERKEKLQFEILEKNVITEEKKVEYEKVKKDLLECCENQRKIQNDAQDEETVQILSEQEITIVQNSLQLVEIIKKVIPRPVYPDPETLPLPEAIFHHILKLPKNQKERSNPKKVYINDAFKIVSSEIYIVPTPAEITQMKEDIAAKMLEEEERKKEEEAGKGKKGKKKDANDEEKVEEEPTEPWLIEYDPKTCTEHSRWIIPAQRTIRIFVKYYNTQVTPNNAHQKVTFRFDSFYSNKSFSINVTGITSVPQIASNPQNVFTNRRKRRPTKEPQCNLSHVYVHSEKQFDFGPLLIGKDPAKKEEENIKGMNSSTFRITNNGKFEAEVKFYLASELKDEDDSKSVAEYKDFQKGIFFIDPIDMKLGLDQSQDIRVWAIPNEVRPFKEELICVVKNNPVPVTFKMACNGQQPVVQVSTQEINFERLLLGKKSMQTLTVKNICQIAVKWKLIIPEDFNTKDEFTIDNLSGELSPTQETEINITFTSIKQDKFEEIIHIEAEDKEDMEVKQDQIEIKVIAEAFQISVNFLDLGDEVKLNFGSVRVGDIAEQIFTAKNEGLYPVKFNFVMTRLDYRENFKIMPVEGFLPAGEEKKITVRFQSKDELKLPKQNVSDITMHILEGQSLEKFEQVMIKVKVDAIFSQYKIKPGKMISLPPMLYDDSKFQEFEVINTCQFPFNFEIYDYFDEETRNRIKQEFNDMKEQQHSQYETQDQEPGKPEKKKDKKPAKKEVKKAAVTGDLKLGQWTISPAKGEVDAYQTQVIKVNFQAKGDKLYQQKLAIHIEHRNPKDAPKGVMYEVIAESCVPGISTENYESIFEEQIVVPSLTSGNKMMKMLNSNVFSIEEKTFYFGTLIPSKHPEGIVERFKITNNHKIQCEVEFKVEKRTQNDDELMFEVNPERTKIGPHEYRYVNVKFKPDIMTQYDGVFEARVVNGDQNPRTQLLTFDLRGEGAMPTLRLDSPNTWIDETKALLQFGKIQIGRTVKKTIILKNDGSMPGTAKFQLTPNQAFKFLDQAVYTISPKQYQAFAIEFTPHEKKEYNWDIEIHTLLNEYEKQMIQIQGQGYEEQINFEDLPNSLEDELIFEDCVINIRKRYKFVIRNTTSDAVRFVWNNSEAPDFIIKPSIGHLQPEGTKILRAYFMSTETVTHEKLMLLCHVQKIKQHRQYQPWDNLMKSSRFVTQFEYDWVTQKLKRKEEAAKLEREQEEKEVKGKGKKKAPAKKKKKDEEEEVVVEEEKMPEIPSDQVANISLSEPVPEPKYEVLGEEEPKEYSLKVSATADLARYDQETIQRHIFFKPTLMYTSRTHSFDIKNTSLIKMHYQLKIINPKEPEFKDEGYFSAAPNYGEILPGMSEEIRVRFSPTEVERDCSRLLMVKIQNLDPELWCEDPLNQQEQIGALIVELNGESERPIVHFELSSSDYRERKEDLDAKYNIIEFESIGTKVKNSKRFYMMNPTNAGYSFEWRVEEKNIDVDTGATFFKCITQKGVILSGKKFEIIFEYTPEIQGTHEAFYIFEIPEHNIKQYFFLVGEVNDPNVFIDVGKVNFGPLLLKGKNKETVHIKNLEHIPFSFTFDKESIHGDPEYANSLIVSPMQGVIRAEGQVAIHITFQPRVETEYNYNILCNVKQKARPISLNIKGIGYTLHHCVQLAPSPTPLNDQELHQVDFGKIYVNEKRSKSIVIENSGDFNFDFVIKKSTIKFLTLSAESGTVKRNDKKIIELTYSPLQDHKFSGKKHFIIVAIISGPSYRFQILGSARKPGMVLSKLRHDFGPCFVLKQPLSKLFILKIKNVDSSAMSIDTLFNKTDYLNVKLPPGQVLLPPSDTDPEQNILEIPIIFTPRDMVKYQEDIYFDINGLHKIKFPISGEGCPLKLELLKAENKLVDFGIKTVGADITKYINIQNNSKTSITISFDIDDQKENYEKYFLRYDPQKEVTINPRERKQIVISFIPKTRLHQFTLQLCYKIVDNGEIRKLCGVSGSCHGIDLKYIQDQINFGPVTVKSKLTKQFNVSNIGDIPARFYWDLTYCKQVFSVKPRKGVIPSHEDFIFDVTFHPSVVKSEKVKIVRGDEEEYREEIQDIRFDKVKCNIQDSKPIYLSLIGKSLPPSEDQIKELNFTATVRKTQELEVEIPNPTDKKHCKITANITTINADWKTYFKGEEYLEFQEGQTSAKYKITYHPLTMTKSEQVPEITYEHHEGTLFFPLQTSGGAILYKLIGIAEPPKEPEDNIEIKVKARETKTQILTIQNWLPKFQSLICDYQLTQEDESIFVSYGKQLDLKVGDTQQRKLTIMALKPCQNTLKVTFKNHKTHEYIYYLINLTIDESDTQGNYELSSIVREPITRMITIENPLQKAVVFQQENIVVDDEHNIKISPIPFTIPADAERNFEIKYRPLVVGKKETKLTLQNDDLGTLDYNLTLIGIASTTEKIMKFHIPLGSTQPRPFKFTHYYQKQTTYQCRIEAIGAPKEEEFDPKGGKAKEKKVAVDLDFEVEPKQFTQPASDNYEGIDASVNIVFEPSTLGESRAMLIITSPEGGEYTCLLYGKSTFPQPKGPFKFGAGAKPNPIQFKNPFFKKVDFDIRVDNPAFTVSAKSPLSLEARKPISISVTYKGDANLSSTGKLTIQCGDLPPWVFYLQGV